MHFEFFDSLMPWLILMVRGWFFIMMLWIAWIHGLVGPCDSDEVIVHDYFLAWFVSSWFGDLGFTWY